MAEPSEIFGPLGHSGEIEQATLATLKLWLPTYAEAVCLEHDFGAGLSPVKSWGVVSEYDRFPEKGLPAVIIEAAGTDSEPESDGAGFQHAHYVLNVTLTIAAATEAGVRGAAQMYSAAVQSAIMQRGAIADGMRVMSWLGESPVMLVAKDQRRTQVAFGNAFRIRRKNVFTAKGGPHTPTPPEDLTEWPEIVGADVEVGPFVDEPGSGD